MLSLFIYCITSIIILRGLIQDSIRYIFIAPYLVYASYIIYKTIGENIDSSANVLRNYTVIDHALLIQTFAVFLYLICSLVFYPKPMFLQKKSKDKKNILRMDFLEIIIIVTSICALVTLYFHFNTIKSIGDSNNYILDSQTIRDIPYFSFLVHFNNSLYCFKWIKGDRINKVLLIIMTIPVFLILILGIRLFLFKFVLLVVFLNLKSIYLIFKKNIFLLLRLKISGKKILRLWLLLIVFGLAPVLMVSVLFFRGGESFTMDLTTAIFQEPVFDAVAFLNALQQGPTIPIENIFYCSLPFIKTNCNMYGAFGISSIWAEIFSYEENYLLLVLMSILLAFLVFILAINKKYEFCLFILASIMSAIIDIWRGNFEIGFLIVFKNIVAFFIIKLFIYLFMINKLNLSRFPKLSHKSK